ncbi:DUF2147 domain-containing protein [Halosquirtibacter laminarini]|uniref:DUF2147 domain-containing protein n=1 Tax=Halosquirtibacter laminarini TaxID=3374600 RepID=A0AC61NR72_9BACT|nr:DUF2147 domain-containing protein [Prolixibacteraceae bacterium]
MKHIFFVAILSVISIAASAQSKLIGSWHTGDQNTVIKIEAQDGDYIGKMISSDNPKARVGEIILKNIKVKKEAWTAKLYAPKRDAWYDVDLHKKDNKLEIRISVGFFSKTLNWTKIDTE